jgi:hypothetical protein
MLHLTDNLIFVGAFFCRNGIKSAASPRMAAQDASGGKVTAIKQSMNLKRFDCIRRTCGLKSAYGREKWRNGHFIEPDQKQKWKNQYFSKHMPVFKSNLALFLDAKTRTVFSVFELNSQSDQLVADLV